MSLSPALRERALFSAKVTNADFLNKADQLIQRILSPETVGGAPAQPGQYMDQPTARLQLKQYLDSIDYAPEVGQAETLQDLSSDSRLNLILQTNVQMAQGYGYFIQGQSPAVLDAFPAQEFFRAEDRIEKRLWGQRWNYARAQLGSDTSALPVDALNGMADEGMFALKNDPIWEYISAFGLPYAPFDFNSGMDVRDVSYSDALDLGLIQGPEDIPAPADRGFNDSLDLSVAELGHSLISALLQSLGNKAKLSDGILSFLPVFLLCFQVSGFLLHPSLGGFHV
jgi:hypothetical protein